MFRNSVRTRKTFLTTRDAIVGSDPGLESKTRSPMSYGRVMYA